MTEIHVSAHHVGEILESENVGNSVTIAVTMDGFVILSISDFIRYLNGGKFSEAQEIRERAIIARPIEFARIYESLSTADTPPNEYKKAGGRYFKRKEDRGGIDWMLGEPDALSDEDEYRLNLSNGQMRDAIRLAENVLDYEN